MSFEEPEKTAEFERTEIELQYSSRKFFRPMETLYIKGPKRVVEEFWNKIMEK